MAVALCHHFMSSNPLNGALGEDRFKGLGGGRKAASAKGSSSWERFLKDNPQREIRQTPRTPQKTNHKPTK
jgi:crossover junction endodeoxyribonuclease RuvC